MLIFYCIVSIFAVIDMSITVGMSWTSLTITENRSLLGVVLCSSVVAPFALSKILKIQSVSWPIIFVVRLIDLASLMTYCQLADSLSPIFFFALAMIHGVSNFYTISFFEQANTKLVMDQAISAQKSSRYLQTAMQSGYFLGAFLAGLFISRLSFSATMTGVSLVGMICCPLVIFAKRLKAYENNIGDGEKQISEDVLEDQFRRAAYFFSVMLGLIGFHIGCFNSLIPITFQKINYWEASSYGYASGLAGLGAFCAGIFPSRRNVMPFLAISLAVTDCILVFIPSQEVVVAACLLLGYSISSLRIEIRGQLTSITKTPEQAYFSATTSSFFFMLMQGFSPLLMTVLTADKVLGIKSTPWLFFMTGLVIAFIFLLSAKHRDGISKG